MDSTVHGLLSGTFGCASPGKGIVFGVGHVRVSKCSFYDVVVSSANGKVPRRLQKEVFRSFVAKRGAPLFSGGMNVNLHVIGGAVSLRRNAIGLSDALKGNDAFALLVPRKGTRFTRSQCRVINTPRVRRCTLPLPMVRTRKRRSGPSGGGASLLIVRSGRRVQRCIYSLFYGSCTMCRTTGNRRKISITVDGVPSLVVSSVVVPMGSKFAYYQRLHRRPQATRVPVLVLATGTRSTSILRTSGVNISSCVVGPFGPRMLGTGIQGLVLRQRHLGEVCAGALVLGRRRDRPRTSKGGTPSSFVRRVVRIVRTGLTGRGFGMGVLTRRLGVDRPALCEGVGRHDRLTTVSVVQDMQVDGTTSLVVRGECSVRRVTRVMKCDSAHALQGRFARRFKISPSGCVRGS